MRIPLPPAKAISRSVPRRSSLLPSLGIAFDSSLKLASSFAGALVCVFAIGAQRVQAEGDSNARRPTAVLLATAGAPTDGEALDSVLHAALEELGVVNITAQPGMDLGAVQLALDCVAESAQCLQAVAAQSGVQMLIAPKVQRTAAELIFSLLRFDTRDGQMRRVLRRQRGHVLNAATLDALPGMLRELFELAAKSEAVVAAPVPPVAAPLPSAATAPVASVAPPLPDAPIDLESRSRPLPVAPLILAGAGVLVVGGGIVAGLMMQQTQADYDKLRPSTTSEMDLVDSAVQKRRSGETLATLANVLFVLGGATVAAGGIWLAVELSTAQHHGYESLTALRPLVGPNQFGLVLTHRREAL
jgi:hypothetical protein